MKNNFKYILEFYKQSVSTQKFILIFLLSIVLSIFGILQVAFGYNYSVGFIRILTFGIYIIGLLLIILLNTKNTYDIFENNNFFIMRFSSKKKYLIELLKTVCFSNFCTILLNLLLLMIGLNLFNHNQTVPKFEIYTLQSNYYIIYIVIKLIILILVISIINVLLLKKFNNLIVISLNFVLYVLIAGFSKSHILIQSIKQIPLFIGDYFVINFYNSFIFEICIFLLYISIVYIIIYFFKKIVLKTMKDVGK